MLKFTKFDLEPKWIDSNICFCGGGAGDPDDTSLSEGQSSVGNVSSSGSTMGAGGFSEEQDARAGTVFGVGGVSKTGSTAQDKAIGWSDGTGGKGANHDALSGATSEQMGVVDAVAAQSKAQGLNATDTQAAVANALSGYEKGSVDRSGGLTDKGKEAVNAAITGVGKDKASQDVEDSYGIPAGIDFSPSVSATNVISGAPTTVSAPSINASNVLSAVSDLAAQSLAARSPTSRGRPNAPTTGIASLAVDSLDRSNPNAMAAAERDQLLGAFGSDVRGGPVTDAQIGIAAAPDVSAQEVLTGIDRSNPNAMAAAERAASGFSPTPADRLAEVYGIDLDALNAAVDDPNAAMGARGPAATDARAGIGYDPVTDMPYGLEFATNPAVPGAQFTTNLAGLTEQQRADQPFSMDLAQKIGSNPYGYEIDPVTGRVVGQIGTPPFGMIGGLTTLAQDLIMGPPQTTQDLIERGVYTGMTGVGGEGSDTAGDGFDEVVKAPTDPCPEGFVMKDGVCTPVDQAGDDAGGGSGNFVFQPPNAPPTFQPITQATPVGQINPFVLQPYPMPPIGINPPRPMQGIQTLSPTGAALGRQI